MKAERRELQTETKIIDAEKGIARFVASDQTLDYSREIILARGWRFDNFAKNSPLVDSHDYSTIEKQLGRIVDFSVQGDQLIEEAQFAIDVPENRLAALAWKMVLGGYLRACSVGFVPQKVVTRWDSDPTAYVQQLQALGLSSAAEDNKPRVIYLEQQQIELSICLIGCNPSALLKGYQDHALSEEDLVALGYGRDGAFDFLRDAAAIYDDAEPAVRAVVRTAMATIFHDRNATSKTAPSAANPGGAEEAPDRRGTEHFFAEFKQLTKPSN